MAGEILAEDDTPMTLTVGDYNARVHRTWAIATEAEQERIIKLLEETAQGDYKQVMLTPKLIARIKGEK